MCFWLHGSLWMLKLTTPTNARRARLLRVTDGTGQLALSGVIGVPGTPHSFVPAADPEAYRRFGTVEVLAPDGDTPRVVTFGNHARAVAHVA
jgi:hypothetical protein